VEGILVDEQYLAQMSTARVPVGSLEIWDSPRMSGINNDHVRALAESDVTLPPIIVQRSTMRVVDGLHRLRASALRGDEEIDVRLFDGGDDEAFVLAVQANVTHGLPLSLAERKAAAARIAESHPQWSDRAIGTATGLSHKTVGAIRRRATGGVYQLHARVRRDGRVRPVSGAAGRQAAGKLIAENPGASLRQIAQLAGISPGTVRDVRDRLRQHEDPVLPPQRHGGGRATGGPTTALVDRASILRTLREDPSLRLTDRGRALIRLLNLDVLGTSDSRRLADSVPPHCVRTVVELAADRAKAWLDFAAQLERRLGGAA
jgi:ParB-like chromosome segregation protein Spo0J